MEYTDEQKRAIECDKGDVLVSASAGSGKTFVMIRRVIRLILEGKTDVDEILAVTYTNLAAAEMKEKLVRALTEKINSPETDAATAERLKKQLDEVPTAAISTVHSFCNDLIKNNFFELGLDASFQIADKIQTDLIKQRAVDALFERKYAEGDEEFKRLLSVFVRRRSDEFLKREILDLHDFFWAEAYPAQFAAAAVDMYSEEGYKKTEDAFFAHYQNLFSQLECEFRALEDEINAVGAVKSAQAAAALANYAYRLYTAPSLDEMVRCAAFVEYRLPPFKAEGDVLPLKERLVSAKKTLVDEADYLVKNFGGQTFEDRMRKTTSSRWIAKALCDLCFEFDAEFSAEKREENLLDFADLEHFALELLDKEDIRTAVSSRYKYVFADEYQDVNGVQEEILHRINSGNTFMVGDVKQSIYAFRGCNPLIFEEKYRRFEGGEGTAISLSANFRSSSAVLNGVNNIFSEIMSLDTCGLDYSRNIMVGGNGESGVAQIHLICPQKDENERKPAKKGAYSVKENLLGNTDEQIFNEGVLIAELIRKTMCEPFVMLDGTERLPEYGDIVILTRSMGAYARKLAETLADNDVPVTSEVKRNVTVYPETRYLISLLKLIDCARQDIPLCAVMRGPIGNFSDLELAQIRTFADSLPKKDGYKPLEFYEAVEKYRLYASDGLQKKTEEFYEYISRLRFLADYEGAGGILERVVREKDIDLYYSARHDGKNRLKRINKLISEAYTAERSYSIKEFLSRLEANDEDFSVTEAGGENAVRLMSIHASKGLEFPIVILAGIHRRFNNSDVKEEIITDRRYGFALKTYDLSEMKVSTNLYCEFLKKQYKKKCATEEMRVLYVALTRAKSRLYLTGEAKSLPSSLTAVDVCSAISYAKMISANCMDIVEYTPESLLAMCVERPIRKVVAGEADPSLKKAITENLTFIYPYDTSLPAKSSVTALLTEDADMPISPVIFKEDEGADVREVGDAYHRFMELADFEKSSFSQIIEQKQQFVKGALMSGEWADMVDEAKVSAILQEDFFHIEGAEYYRELPFEVLMPSKMVTGADGDDEVLVQGVMDIIAFTPDGIRLADYKVSNRTKEGLRRHYEKQLEMYAYAAEKITGKKVVSRTLFNLKTGERVELE